MTKQVISVESINSICYDIAHDLDLVEKDWLIPALKSHVHHYAKNYLVGYNYGTVEKLVTQWILVKQGKLNPVPRNYP